MTLPTDPFLVREILPDNVKPLHYDVHLTPNLETFEFKGVIAVRLQIVKDTNSIVCNAAELKFASATFSEKDGKPQAASGIQLDAKEERATFLFSQVLKAGTEGVLNVEFTGIHSDKMSGFYRSQYTDGASKEKKTLVVTQFEPTDARKAFPCWDEPAIKATFDITLTVREHFTALSNMNDVETIAIGDGLKRIRFATTPVMSTYLVAFVVGELDVIETKTPDARQTLVRVFAPHGQVHQGAFGLEVAAKTLTFFAEYFDIAYPLPKMDMIAIPDFAAGAMENWGLVTYRNVYLLFEEGVSAAKSKQNIAYVVAHELAHQWFGNLVTMGWWQDLWLNEGFATFVGWLAVDKLFPEWKIWSQFVDDDLQRGLKLDALRSSHPIEVPVKNAAEIHQIFDAISYSKGACVIRMLVAHLGEDKFQQGIRNYLKKFKYRNADTKDLWDALSGASGKPVAEVMHSWTRGITAADDEAIWSVPLQIISSASQTAATKEMLDRKEGVFGIPGLQKSKLDDGDFYKINFEQTCFYRTNYTSSALKRLGQSVKAGKLGISDRIGIITDLFALAQGGVTSVVSALELLNNYRDETAYILGAAAVRLEEPKEVTDALKGFVCKLFGALVQKIGWHYDQNEGFLDSLLRTLAITVAGKAGDVAVVEESKKRFQQFLAGQEDAIHPNLRGAIFSIVLQHGGAAEFDNVLKLYRETTVADQKVVALAALGATANDDLLKRALDVSLSEDVRPQDIHYVLNAVASNPLGRVMAWEFVKAKWNVLHERYYSGSMSMLGRIVAITTDSFTGETRASEVRAFFADKELEAISRSIQQSLEKIDANTKWLERDRAAVASWIKSRQ